MIRRAEAADADTIYRLNQEGHDAPQDPEAIAEIIAEKSESVFLDPDAPAVVWLHVAPKRKLVVIVWFAPASARFQVMMPLLRTAVGDVAEKWPADQIADYEIGGDLPPKMKGERDVAERALRTWKGVIEREGLPAHVERRGEDWHGWIRFGDAVTLAERWLPSS